MDISKLADWNPWWENKILIEKLVGRPRPRYHLLIDSVRIKEATIITGVRRSGKSTIMYQMIKHLLAKGVGPEQILFVNLEDKRLAKDSLDDIYECYRENVNSDSKSYIFLDEVHRKENWESWVRKKYDLKEDIKFVISGSCSYLLRREYSTLLTGRNITFDVLPLNFEEFLLFKNIDVDKIKKGIILQKTKIKIQQSLKEFTAMGGFPEVFFKEKEFKLKVLEQYFDDIIYKDIVDRYNLNSQKTKDFALYLMTNFTGNISLRNLRNSLNLSYDTIKEYISSFKEAFLFFTIDYFSYSLKEQKTRPSKIYCIDNGLRNAVSFKFSKDEGKLAENLVFLELRSRGKDVYYWKSEKQKEVDFAVKNKDGSLTAVNVSYADDINERETDALLEFKQEFKKAKHFLVITKEHEARKSGIQFIPLWKWLLLEK
jgi:hypothetical protein